MAIHCMVSKPGKVSAKEGTGPKGWVPLGLEALMRAIELNGVQVDNNKSAFEWGRRCAHDLAAVQALVDPKRRRALLAQADRLLADVAAGGIDVVGRFLDPFDVRPEAGLAAKVQRQSIWMPSRAITRATAGIARRPSTRAAKFG